AARASYVDCGRLPTSSVRHVRGSTATTRSGADSRPERRPPTTYTVPSSMTPEAWVVGAGSDPIARARRVPGVHAYIVRLAFPFGSEPPATINRPAAAATAA